MADVDPALLRRLRARDERAFRELVDAHGRAVIHLCYRMLGNRAEAEDLAQEVFIAVFKTIEGFREESKFTTWLYRIAVNHAKNRIKYLARRHDRKQDELDEMAPGTNDAALGPARATRPERALEGAQLDAQLQAALATLDEEHRVLVVLRDVEELSIEEIAEITGLPDGTIKSRLHRARAALRKKLERHGVMP